MSDNGGWFCEYLIVNTFNEHLHPLIINKIIYIKGILLDSRLIPRKDLGIIQKKKKIRFRILKHNFN